MKDSGEEINRASDRSFFTFVLSEERIGVCQYMLSSAPSGATREKEKL